MIRNFGMQRIVHLLYPSLKRLGMPPQIGHL